MMRSIAEIGIALSLCAASHGAEISEPLLRNLPAGVQVDSCAEVSGDARDAISKKLGGTVGKLTNSMLQVHGRGIRVNVITGADEAAARAIEASLSKMKSAPFLVRKGNALIEYAGNDIDDAIARKTSWELGLLPRPERVRYKMTAEIGVIEEADYMALNPLFNQLLALKSGAKDAERQVADSVSKFTFGRTLAMRNPGTARYSFQPAPVETKEDGASVKMIFGELPRRHGISFVTATIEMEANSTGRTESAASPDKSLTAATPFWPAGDPAMKELAAAITKGKKTNSEKADAILEWLSPGKNIRYAGQTGSRWGTAKVVTQKFGHCWDFSDCFVTLCRAAGVPSRQVAGWLYGTSGHVWAEYHVEGTGWQQVDPTGGNVLRCGIYHLPYFTTENGEMPVLYLSMPKIEALP